MHLLIIHPEAEYFAGAEKVMGYYLQGLQTAGCEVSIAAVEQSRVRQLIPDWVTPCWVPPNARFSLIQFLRQLRTVRRAHQARPFDLVHGWAVRDWELTTAVARVLRRPAVGTLHDHPQAPFISRVRRRLMAWTAARFQKVVCVSEALRQACLHAGYPPARLTVVRNGLPPAPEPSRATRDQGPFRLGFLGQFTERKGLRGLFEILEAVSTLSAVPWELVVAGETQNQEGKALVQAIHAKFSTRPWWPRVRWCGWVKNPDEFLASLDLLVCPSSEFDPFPTVVLEAGRAGVPVLGARIGGVPEMVDHNRTGWLFGAQAWAEAARQLRDVLERPELARNAGAAAKKRVEGEFTIRKMVENYLNVYSEISVCNR